MNNFNNFLQNIIVAKRQGKSPSQIMQNLLNSNPQYQQSLTRLQNMAQGRSPREFIMQMARQNGAEETTLAMLEEIFNN